MSSGRHRRLPSSVPVAGAQRDDPVAGLEAANARIVEAEQLLAANDGDDQLAVPGSGRATLLVRGDRSLDDVESGAYIEQSSSTPTTRGLRVAIPSRRPGDWAERMTELAPL